MDLNKRVLELEKRAGKEQPKEPEARHFDPDAAMARLCAAMMCEPPDRETLLTLEERLAIARREAVPKPEVWADRWDPSLGKLRYQLIPQDTGPANTARELEIMILQRDGKITPPEATRLRGGRLELELPFPVVIGNEDAVADEALRKCPPRESLSLEEQLRLETEEMEEYKDRATRLATEGLGESFRASSNDCMITLHQQRIAELQRKIADRDQKRGL